MKSVLRARLCAWVATPVFLRSQGLPPASARLLLLTGFRGSCTDRYSDYRKFPVKGVTKPGECNAIDD